MPQRLLGSEALASKLAGAQEALSAARVTIRDFQRWGAAHGYEPEEMLAAFVWYLRNDAIARDTSMEACTAMQDTARAIWDHV